SNLCAIMKPLLDGLVSTCHAPPESVQMNRVARIADQLGEEPSCVKKWLERGGLCLLSGRCPVRLYRGGTMWSPDDHRCVAAAMHRRSGSANDNRIDIRIFPMISRP